ncbi:MAG: class I SAM-dependent RNA methyltransferase [Alphaproteobacteria bacterium]|nr:class I SAM-dependent RNA methyltransferase [Alphaproteobacteria bacterium]
MTDVWAPPCPLFGTCGGCSLQDLSWDQYADFKLRKLKVLFERENLPTDVITPLSIIKGKTRRRALLRATKVHQSVHLGFYQRGSHDIVNMTACEVLRPEIFDLLTPLRKLLSFLIPAKKRVEIEVLHTEVGLDVVMTGKELPALNLSLIEKLTAFAEDQALARLRVNDTLILQRHVPVVSFNGVKVAADAKGFLQASADADALLTEAVLSLLPETPDTVADLFCGRGLFTFALRARARVVHAYDSDDAALGALRAAAKAFPGRVKEAARNLFQMPLNASELKDVDVALLDPPRVGAMGQCKELAKSAVPHVIYVSCNPESFVKDAARLVAGGYTLEALHPLDQFLWSPHLEVIASFKRKDS